MNWGGVGGAGAVNCGGACGSTGGGSNLGNCVGNNNGNQDKYIV